ncbi:beta/gamma crystallin domain-containing protein [Streptomyces sp. NPDC001212]|uniref:beta/gamma crystallin domain-containing protein n=1 Tax=Streptomyces sp. HYC2 TaxID=2955207 RepID=UPI002480ECFA|nr:beta/gamma crystallin domain-containing protein [Streptomyces sp. HYC2]
MNRNVKRAVVAALTTLTAAASLTLATTSPASAIDKVTCGPSDYLNVKYHLYNQYSWSGPYNSCFANAGESDFVRSGTVWVDQISTGNNRVQWYGDGRWQPDQPIGKWTVFSWPNHPGGVRLDKIRIL